MFGLDSGHFFICEGEVYIPKDKIDDPPVKEFIVPHCHLVGYKHRVESQDGALTIIDDEPYLETELSDEEFIDFRKAWRSGIDKAL
jgi:hypothetical protein